VDRTAVYLADLVDRPGYVIAAIRQIVVDWPALSG